jgi:hypothetical protein
VRLPASNNGPVDVPENRIGIFKSFQGIELSFQMSYRKPKTGFDEEPDLKNQLLYVLSAVPLESIAVSMLSFVRIYSVLFYRHIITAASRVSIYGWLDPEKCKIRTALSPTRVRKMLDEKVLN